MPLTIPTTQLDSTSQNYLQQAEAYGGKGVFIPRPRNLTNSRSGWRTLVFLGLVAWCVAVVLSWPPYLVGPNWRRVAYFQAGLTTVGTLLLGVGLRRGRRPIQKAVLGQFVYADARYLWQVSADTVEVVELEPLQHADDQIRLVGTRTVWQVRLSFPWGNWVIQLGSVEAAQHLTSFLNLCKSLRTTDEPGLREVFRHEPHKLGAVALGFCQGQETFNLADLHDVPPIPTPYAVESVMLPGRQRRWSPWWTTAAVAAFTVLALPWLNGFLLEGHLHAQVVRSETASFEPLHQYLAYFPAGYRSEEVRALVDDRRFELARRESDQKRSPAKLRDYLANDANQRHRVEAQQLIDGYYDTVIALLRQRAAEQANQIDPPLFEALLALVDALKKAGSPVVTVGFQATQDDAPTTNEGRVLERALHAQRVQEHPEIARIAQVAPDQSAIMSRGLVFDARQTRRRESVILQRLREAVRQGLDADLLALQPVADGIVPIMEVAYHTQPSGQLYLYTHTDDGPGRPKRETIRGLLRGYAVSWTITIRPPGSDQVHTVKLGSAPAEQLRMESAVGDPAWAPYAVILYSAFFDMSSRLVHNFGLTPGPAPEVFTFQEVAGQARK